MTSHEVATHTIYPDQLVIIPVIIEALEAPTLDAEYLTAWLQALHPDLTKIDVNVASPTHFIFQVDKKPASYINPIMLEQDIEQKMGEHGLALIDSDISFPYDENDLNCFKLDLTFA